MAKLGFYFSGALPFTGANLSIDLAVDFLHKVVFVAVVMKEIAGACFARKDCLAGVFGVHKHGVAVRAECPSVDGASRYV